jgi:3-hydroxypropanoate dehydrogenase
MATTRLDCNQTSAFSNDAVHSEFVASTRITSNFICSISYGSNEDPFPSNATLAFEEARRCA